MISEEKRGVNVRISLASLALVVAMLTQAVACVWWTARLQFNQEVEGQRLAVIEARYDQLARERTDMLERMVRVEETGKQTHEIVVDIKTEFQRSRGEHGN